MSKYPDTVPITPKSDNSDKSPSTPATLSSSSSSMSSSSDSTPSSPARPSPLTRRETHVNFAPSPPVNDGQPIEPSPRVHQNFDTNKPNRGPEYEPISKEDVPAHYDYGRFYMKTHGLLKELKRLQFAFKTVGGAGPALVATQAMWMSFKQLVDLFGVNTDALFPDSSIEQKQGAADWADFKSNFSQAACALRQLEGAFKTFQNAYYEYHTIYRLNHLRRRLEEEAGRLHVPSTGEAMRIKMQLLLTSFLIKDVGELRKNLSEYCDTGIPIISSAQEARSSRYLNLTTISTFLSAVTAIFLPISAEQPVGTLNVGVNTLLFSSLAFSIASAINSLLAVSWSKSIVHDANSHLPLWAIACVYTGPMFSLVVSAALFVAGLCLFVFSSGQHVVTLIFTVAFAGLYTVCLLGFGVWLITEKWRFRRNAPFAVCELMDFSLSLAIIDLTFAFLRRKTTRSGMGPGNFLEFDRVVHDRPADVSFGARSTGEVFVQMQDAYIRSTIIPGEYSPSDIPGPPGPGMLPTLDTDNTLRLQTHVVTIDANAAGEISFPKRARAEVLNDSGDRSRYGLDETHRRHEPEPVHKDPSFPVPQMTPDCTPPVNSHIDGWEFPVPVPNVVTYPDTEELQANVFSLHTECAPPGEPGTFPTPNFEEFPLGSMRATPPTSPLPAAHPQERISSSQPVQDGCHAFPDPHEAALTSSAFGDDPSTINQPPTALSGTRRYSVEFPRSPLEQATGFEPQSRQTRIDESNIPRERSSSTVSQSRRTIPGIIDALPDDRIKSSPSLGRATVDIDGLQQRRREPTEICHLETEITCLPDFNSGEEITEALTREGGSSRNEE